MSLLVRSLVALLVAVTANANQPCDMQDCGEACFYKDGSKVPLPPITFASPGGAWSMSAEEQGKICTQRGEDPYPLGVRIKACNNNSSLEYPDIGGTVYTPDLLKSINITCAEDHPCPDGITVHVSLCC